ncbi:MAG: hypothetical protein V4631_22280 [Pseudomonadota bacterium]
MKKNIAFLLMIASCAPALAAKAYYVSATDVYARKQPQSYAMGRLYKNERFDIQYVDSNGWGYGYAYGSVNRCIWMQYSTTAGSNFWTHGTAVSDKCRTTNTYLLNSEFTNGEIWMNSTNTDGRSHILAGATHMWDNWSWGARTGNAVYRGTAPAGSRFIIRYTTNDGAGVMARPCNASGCSSDWFFIQRAAL